MVGQYDPLTSTFYLRNSNSPGLADLTFIYGPAGAGSMPLVGDWNGDGVDTIGLYDPPPVPSLCGTRTAVGWPTSLSGMGWRELQLAHPWRSLTGV